MSDTFVKSTRAIKDVQKQPHYTNQPGDILIEKSNKVFVRTEDSYCELTGNIKAIDGNTPDNNGNANSLNFRVLKEMQYDQADKVDVRLTSTGGYSKIADNVRGCLVSSLNDFNLSDVKFDNKAVITPTQLNSDATKVSSLIGVIQVPRADTLKYLVVMDVRNKTIIDIVNIKAKSVTQQDE